MTLVAEQPSTLSLSAYGQARSTIEGSPLSPDELRKIDAYWRACKYLALGMIYLLDNPLTERAAEAGAHQEPAARALGIEPRSGVHLHSFEPADQEARPGHDLHGGAGARSAWRSRARLSRRDLLRDLSGKE